MANKVHAFKHRDAVRIVKAARAAGVAVDQLTVNPHTGDITVGPAQSTAKAAADLDAELAEFEARHGGQS